MELKGFVQLFILGLLLAGCSVSRSEVYPSRIVSGLYMEEIENPIFYDSFIPIIYEYNYPNWSVMDVTLRDWRGLCQSDDFAPSYTCPVFFYLERFIERMQNEIVRQTTKGFARQVHAEMHDISDLCNRVQAHFHSLVTKKSSFEKYLQSLRSCPVQGSQIRRAVNDYVYNIKYIYQQMVSKFEREFSSKTGAVGATDRTGPAFYVNQLTSAQGFMMFNYWVEHNRWETAAHSCIQQLIPTTLIKPANLTESIRKTEEEATKQKLVLSIPANESGVYLNSPLADCTYTDANTFVVRILVPVKKKTSNAKLIRLQSVPFLLNDNDKYSICETMDATGQYIYDEISGFLTNANSCGPENLCQLDDPSRMSLPTLCAAAFFSRSQENVKKYCDFVCQDNIDGLYPGLPIFSRVKPDTIVVTGNNNVELVIKCEGKRDEIVNPDQLGSLEIVLPCHCALHYRSHVFLPEQQRCGSQLITRVILPVHFFTDEFLATGASVNFTGNSTANMMDPKLFASSTDADNNIINIQEDVESGREQSFELLDKSSSGKLESVNNSLSSSSTAVVWLWVLFIIQSICVFACLFFILRQLDFAPWVSFSRRGSGRNNNLSFSNPTSSVSTENIVERATKVHRSDGRNEEPYPV